MKFTDFQLPKDETISFDEILKKSKDNPFDFMFRMLKIAFAYIKISYAQGLPIFIVETIIGVVVGVFSLSSIYYLVLLIFVTPFLYYLVALIASLFIVLFIVKKITLWNKRKK